MPAVTNPALEPRNGDGPEALREKARQVGFSLIANTTVKENAVEALGAPAEHKAAGPVQVATFSC